VIDLVKRFFAPTEKETSSSFYLADRVIELQRKVTDLQKRVEELENEKHELQDLIIETEISLQAQIDRIHPVIYNFTDTKKEE
jgi:uncharacterized protein YlxW (UPF0749 family)